MVRAASGGGRRWLILAVIAIAQLMVVLDGTVVNIALPPAQKALDFSNADRQWIITAYALAFGSLLLLGGKLADLFGRKLMFMAGLTSFATLVAARTSQGVFSALLAPAGLSLPATTFPDKAERGKAFGAARAIVGSGGAAGLLFGGVLTQYLSWRWCLYIDLMLAAVGIRSCVAGAPAGPRRAAQAGLAGHGVDLRRNVRPGPRILQRQHQ